VFHLVTLLSLSCMYCSNKKTKSVYQVTLELICIETSQKFIRMSRNISSLVCCSCLGLDWEIGGLGAVLRRIDECISLLDVIFNNMYLVRFMF